MPPKIVTIIGATGAQGRGVASAFLSNPSYHVRAVTRNPTSPAALSLASQGAELVTADLDSLPSLTSAFAGSSIIFAVTDFSSQFVALGDPHAAAEAEYRQGVNLALAASSTLSSLEHYIWSTLPTAVPLSDGRYSIPHFEGKARVDEYLRTKHAADLLKKTTFLWVTFYATNYAFPMFAPAWLPTAETHVQLGSWVGETPVACIGDVSANLGPFVKAIVDRPDVAANGAIVLAEVETLSVDDMLQLWARVKETKAKFVRIEKRTLRELWGPIGDEVGMMMEFWDDVREKSWTDASGKKILTREELGVKGLQGVEEAFKRLGL